MQRVEVTYNAEVSLTADALLGFYYSVSQQRRDRARRESPHHRRSVADGSGDRDASSSGAMGEHVGASRMPDGLQSEQANLEAEQARMMLG